MQRASINPDESPSPHPVQTAAYDQGWRGPQRAKRELAPDFRARAEEAAQRFAWDHWLGLAPSAVRRLRHLPSR